MTDTAVHEGSGDVEGKRARVRRLLIEPLQELGLRFKRGTPEDVQRKTLAGICDDLSYMSDRGLGVMVASLRSKGEGSSKSFWPPRVAVIGLAQAFEPRPFDELPGLRRWFISKAGTEAVEAKREVAEYDFWVKHHRPPVIDRERRIVEQTAAEMAARAERVGERRDRQVGEMHPGDFAWLDDYLNRQRRVREMIAEAHQ